MLPRALECAEAPAKALLDERAEGIGCLGPGNRVLGIGDTPAALAQLDGRILVLGQRVVREAPRLEDRAATPRADGARYHRDAVQQVEGAPVHVLAGHVLQRLPSRDEVEPVADLRVAGHGADGRIAQRCHQFGDGLRLEHRVGIEADDDLACRAFDAVIQCTGLAAVLLHEHAHARVVTECGACDRPRAIGRSVVDHHHIQRAGEPLREQAVNGLLDDRGFVECRHDDGDVWREVQRLSSPARGAHPMHDGERQHDENAQRAKYHRDQEHPRDRCLHGADGKERGQCDVA